MKYVCLIYDEEKKKSAMSKAESDALVGEYFAFSEEIRKARARFSGSKRTVIDGPFAETKELIAGYWLRQVKSKEEAIEWVKRCPNPYHEDGEIEIRQVFEAEDFGAKLDG